MAEIFGGVAGGIQLADAFLKLASELRRFIHTVRYAPQQVYEFRRDLSNFSASLRMFGEQSEKGLKYLTDPQQKKRRVQYITGVFQECKMVKKGFEQLLSRFCGDNIELPSFHGYLDRVRWYFGRKAIAGLKMSLECAKSSISLFLLLHNVEFLHRKIDKLIKKSQEVPEDLVNALYQTKRQLKQQRRDTKEAQQLLFEYIKASIHSNQAPLVQDIRPIIQERSYIERSTTKTVRKKSRRILHQSSTNSSSRDFYDISPSSSPGPTARATQGPRITPPAPGHTSISQENISHTRDKTPPQQSISLNASSSPSIAERTENIGIRQGRSPLRGLSPSGISSVRSRSPPIFGSIVRDDGTGIMVIEGEWRRQDDDRQSISEPSPIENIRNVEPSESLYSIGQGGGENNEGEKSEEKNVEGDFEWEEENEKNASNSGYIKTAKHGYYKAVPPFLDSNWKGVRRPST